MIKVMLVEDDKMVREVNNKLLMKIDGFKIISEAGSINEAKENILKKVPDLILLDIFLPDGKGVDLLKWIRKEELKIDVILISADNSLNTVDEAFKLGAVDYLVKPFIFKRFEKTLVRYRNRFREFKEKDILNQKIIDNYILNNHMEDNNLQNTNNYYEVTKGINENTYKKIWDCIILNKDKKFTSDDLSSQTGLARVTVRRYLEHMCNEKKLKLTLEYGKIGRPVHYYVLSKI